MLGMYCQNYAPLPGSYDILVTVTGCVPVNDEFYSAQTSLVTTL